MAPTELYALNSQLSTLQLLLHLFNLPIEYLAGEAIDGDVKPIALFTFDDEVSPRQILGVRFVFSGLGDNIDKQVPIPRSSYLSERARDRLLLCPLMGARSVQLAGTPII